MFFIAKAMLGKMPKNLLSHSKRVSVLGYILSKQVGLTTKECNNIALGGLLHDVGKCSVKPSILNKKDTLTQEEFNEIKLHCTYGVNIIQNIKNDSPILPIIQYHHERWDGLGYFGLKNSEIPLAARIISIVDAFDAMTSYRPYQAKREEEDALMELIRCANSQFDPDLVKEFNSIYPSLSSHLTDYNKFIEHI